MKFEVLPVTRFQQNCSILWCEQTGRAAVVDPGGNLDEIIDFIELMELEPEVAIITHGHFDHCGAAAEFAALTGARIEGPHYGDVAAVRNLEQWGAHYGVTAKTFEPERWLNRGDIIRFGDETLEVLHCPGHTSGHVAYFSRQSKQAFVGDILFRGAIGAWQGPDGNLPLLIHSIRNKLFPLGDDVSFVPGHGRASTIGHERRSNPFVSDEAYARWCEQFPVESAPAIEAKHS